MQAEILAIGSELLLGEVIDTNSAAIAKKLQSVGIPTRHIGAVGDDQERIAAAVRLGLARSEVLVCTGGLGPTVDDMTREAVAQALGKPLVFDEDLLAQIEERFRRLGRPMGENNRRQAFRPEGSAALENPVGTAPCFSVEQDGHVAICLPGVPREMEYMLDHAVLPWLRRRFPQAGVVKSRALHLAGVGESLVDERIGDLEALANPAVGLNAKAGTLTVRITAHAADADAAGRLIAPVEAQVRERLGGWVFGADGDTLEAVALAALRRRGETLASVESGTAGRLAGRLAAAGQGVFGGGRVVCGLVPEDIGEWARQAALEAGADWGLACAFVEREGAARLGVGVYGPARAATFWRGFAGHPALAPEWSSSLALDALRASASQA